jgi:hypothetical protein
MNEKFLKVIKKFFPNKKWKIKHKGNGYFRLYCNNRPTKYKIYDFSKFNTIFKDSEFLTKLQLENYLGILKKLKENYYDKRNRR